MTLEGALLRYIEECLAQKTKDWERIATLKAQKLDIEEQIKQIRYAADYAKDEEMRARVTLRSVKEDRRKLVQQMTLPPNERTKPGQVPTSDPNQL